MGKGSTIAIIITGVGVAITISTWSIPAVTALAITGYPSFSNIAGPRSHALLPARYAPPMQVQTTIQKHTYIRNITRMTCNVVSARARSTMQLYRMGSTHLFPKFHQKLTNHNKTKAPRERDKPNLRKFGSRLKSFRGI